MASHAQCGDVRLLRLVPIRIIRMRRERAVAALAGNLRVLPLAPLLRDVVVADGTCCLACERDRSRANFAERGRPVVAILRKAWGNNEAPNDQEHRNPQTQDEHKTDQMLRLFQHVLHR